MKIIAIRTLPGCSQEYLKILKSKTLYRLYTEYEIDEQDRISIQKEIPLDFFFREKTSPQLTVNISAIVGKNGAGKSSIIELIMRAINNIAIRYMKSKNSLIFIPKLFIDLYFTTDNQFYKCQVRGKTILFFKQDKISKKLNEPIPDFDLKNFFYTIAVNYSHYAYNSGDFDREGDWLGGVFHKNDGYQTPLVLNPYRESNDIAIDNEKHLIKSRLIANLALANHNQNTKIKQLSDGAEVEYLRLKKRIAIDRLTIYKDRIVEKDISSGEPKHVTVDVTLQDIFDNREKLVFLKRLAVVYKFPFDNKINGKYKEVYDYIIYKTIRIAIKYFEDDLIFFKGARKFDSIKQDRWINDLLKEPSHITLKLRQTINFLRQKHFKYEDQNLSLKDLDTAITSIPTTNKQAVNVVEFVPPPIFDVEIFLKTYHSKKIIPFSALSSGEKQLTYSIQSLFYHLLNIESVYSNTKKRTAYRNVNIFLEEVEMYAHPEMQRRYISNILTGIKNLGLKKIKGINICFLTHSPFVLTDIPDSNILFLTDNGNTLEKDSSPKTFGGNIHDLLANSFFLDSGTIGSFSHQVINELIEEINEIDKNAGKKEKDRILNMIEIIGEPFLRIKITDLFYSKFSNEKRIAELEEEIKRLKDA